MASLFSRLFNHPTPGSHTLETLEQIVSRVDPRLTVVPDYQRRLLPAVEALEQHIAQLLADLPEATELRCKRYAGNPELALFFSSPERIIGLLHGSGALRKWQQAQQQPSDCYCLLGLQPKPRQRLGCAMQNGVLRRDVKLPYIDFSSYRLVGLSSDLGLMMDKLQQRALDEYCNQALDALTRGKTDCLALQREQDLLRSRLQVREGRHKGFGAELQDRDQLAKMTEQEMLERLEAIQQTLDALKTEPQKLEQQLEELAEFLTHADQVVHWQRVVHHVDNNGILVSEDDPEGHPVRWLQLTMRQHGDFVIYPLVIPAEEIRSAV